jgi:hypothetical protein
LVRRLVLVKDIQMVYCYEDLLDETIQLGDSGRRIVYALLLKPTEQVRFKALNPLFSLSKEHRLSVYWYT